MSITTEIRNDLISLVVGAFKAAPGTTLLNSFASQYNANPNTAAIALSLQGSADFVAAYPTFLSNQEFATRVVDNILEGRVTTADRQWAIDTLLADLNKGAGRAELILSAVKELQMTTNPAWANAKAAFVNQVDVATFHTVSLGKDGTLAQRKAVVANVTEVAATVTTAKAAESATVAQTFTLTTGTDNLVATAGDDTITAGAGTLTAGDVIDGGAGVDTLNVTITGTAPAQSATSLKNVEIINITASPNPGTVDMTGVTGVTAINNSSSANGATVTVSNVGNVVNSTITNSQTATTVNYTTAAVAGTADASTVTLSGVSAGSSYVTAGVETITLVSGGSAANVLGTLGTTGITRLNISGDNALTITNAVGGATIATVDASAATGNVVLTTGNGPAATGVTVTGPTAATAGITVTTGTGKDTVTLGAGNNTVVTGAGADTINSGAGVNTITPGAGNDAINLNAAGTDTIRYAEAGAANADTVSGFSSNDVIAINLGAAATATANASANATFGTLQTGGTSPVLSNVGGTGTGTAISFAAILPTANATTNTVPATANVLALNGVFTDGTTGGVITALSTAANAGITTTATGKFLLVTYSVGNIAQVWAYAGDTTSNSDIDSGELSLVATLNGVTQNSLTAANFATYLTPAAATTAVSNSGQTINLTTPLNTVQSTANTAGQFLTAANDTINVSVGMLPTGAASTTSGLTVIDPSSTDADVLNATVLNALWDNGSVISGIETVNLNMLVADGGGFAMTSILPGTTNLGVTGAGNMTGITNVLSGTAFTLGAGYTGSLTLNTGAIAAATLNLNGTAGTSAATSPTFGVGAAVTALTVNANANTTVNLDLNTTSYTTATFNGTGNVTVFDTAANLHAANVVATSPAYSGTLTFRPSTSANMDFAAGGVVSGLRVIDFTDIAANGVTGTTITLPAVTGGGSLTITDAPTTARDSSIQDLVVVQSGSSLADSLTFNFGASLTPALTGAITAASTETLNINYSPTTAGTAFSVANITLAAALGNQTVNISGTGAFTLGTVTADVLNATGVGSTGSIASATLANGTSGVIFNGGAGAASIIGSTAADQFNGGGGNDTFRNTAGGAAVTAADRMTGGAGNDTFILSGISAQAGTAVATAYTAAPNVTDFSISGANGVDILSLSSTLASSGQSASRGLTANTAVAAGSTVITSMNSSSAGTAFTANTALVKLTAATAVTGTLQDLFNAAIGTSTITGFTNGDDVFVSLFDSTNLRMVILSVDVAGGATNTVLETGDVVTLVGTIDMTSANYTSFAAANLAVIGS